MSDDGLEASLTALDQSLLAYSSQKDSPTNEYIQGFDPLTNPRQFRPMGDTAQYWVGASDQLLTMTFPAMLNMSGRFVKLGPYFSINTASSIGLDDLKKAKAQFEILPLNPNGLIPEEALKMSNTAFGAAIMLIQEAEDKLDKDLPADKIPAKHVPFRTYSDENYYSLIITTPPMFSNIPSAAMNMPKITRGSLSSLPPLSPRKAFSGNSSFSVPSAAQDFNKMSSLSDPLGLYSGLGRNVDISSITINKPEVRNCNGALIHPSEYRTVLKDRAFVGVQVCFKMWDIGKRGNFQSGSQDNPNGSRTYQLILRQLQLLPDDSVTKTSIIKSLTSINPTNANAIESDDANSNVAVTKGKRKSGKQTGSSKKKTRMSKTVEVISDDGDLTM